MKREKYTDRVIETSYSIVNSRVDAVRRKNILKTGLRVYKDGFIGVSGAVGEYDEKLMLKEAEENLEIKIPYSFDLSHDLKLHREFKAEIENEKDFLNEVEEFLEELKRDQKDFIFSNKINIVEREVSLINDENLDLKYNDKYVESALLFKEKSSPNIIDGGFDYFSRKYKRADFLKTMNELCSAYKNKLDIPLNKRMPVVFVNGDQTLFKMFYTDLNGKSYGAGNSIFKGKIGSNIFNENFSLYQSRNPKDTISPFFDAEGVVNEDFRYNLIENGKLLNPYTDKRTAKNFNLPLTGSASCEYNGVPSLSPTQLFAEKSHKTIKELLKGEPAVLVVIASGGDYTDSGSFGTPVQLSYLFDGERLIGRLPELKVSSSIYKMFGEDYIGASCDKISPLSNEGYLALYMDVERE